MACVKVTPLAFRRIKELVAQEGDSSMGLRLTVQGGGCAGFKYHFVLDNRIESDDQVIETKEARVIVDNMSASLLKGAEIDFVEEMIGSSFVVKNPNVAASCGCGNSFSF